MNKEEITNDLIEKIKREEYLPGQWLVERELSLAYGISRTPVREILRDMSTTGMVEWLPARGYRVRELRLEDILELFHAREAVEGMAARLACQTADESFFEEMEAIKEPLATTIIREDADKGIAHGRNIHDRIMDAAGNSILSEFYIKLKNMTALTRNITRRFTHIEEHSQKAHLKIIKAIEARDPARCEKTMREHLQNTCKGLIEGYLNARTGVTNERRRKK